MLVADIFSDLANLGSWFSRVWPLFVIMGVVAGVGRRITKVVLDGIDAKMDAKLQPITTELNTNGGSTLKDAVNRIESNLVDISKAATEAIAVSTVNKSRLDAVVSGMDTAYYEMNENGVVTFVNDSYLRLFELTRDEALYSTRWRNKISKEDLDAIDRSGKLAQDNHTEWVSSFRVASSRGPIMVTGHAKPLFYGDKFVGFSGVLIF